MFFLTIPSRGEGSCFRTVRGPRASGSVTASAALSSPRRTLGKWVECVVDGGGRVAGLRMAGRWPPLPGRFKESIGPGVTAADGAAACASGRAQSLRTQGRHPGARVPDGRGDRLLRSYPIHFRWKAGRAKVWRDFVSCRWNLFPGLCSDDSRGGQWPLAFGGVGRPPGAVGPHLGGFVLHVPPWAGMWSCLETLLFVMTTWESFGV